MNKYHIRSLYAIGGTKMELDDNTGLPINVVKGDGVEYEMDVEANSPDEAVLHAVNRDLYKPGVEWLTDVPYRDPVTGLYLIQETYQYEVTLVG